MTIDNPANGDYYFIEQTSMNFYVTKVKAIVTVGSSTPSFAYTLKRARNGTPADIGV